MVSYDGASEDTVEARVISRLTHNWIVTPQQSRAYPEALRNKVRGHYLITSSKYLAKKHGSRKEYAKHQARSRGVPDIAITCDEWGQLWLMTELKKNTAKKSLTTEQQELVDFGRILIVRNPDEVIEAIKDFDRILGIRRQEPWR